MEAVGEAVGRDRFAQDSPQVSEFRGILILRKLLSIAQEEPIFVVGFVMEIE